MSPPKFVICGSGRCGTLWAAEVLRAGAVNCGHQAIFRHETVLGRDWKWGHHHGDSSFEAVPMLDDIDAIKIALVREPLAVMRSWRGLGLFVDRVDTWQYWGLLSRVLDAHMPAVLSCSDPMAAAAMYWLGWTKLAVQRCDEWFRIESLEPHTLFDAVQRSNQYRTMAEDVPRNTNHRTTDKKDRGPHSWDELPDDVRGPVQDFASKLGYE